MGADGIITDDPRIFPRSIRFMKRKGLGLSLLLRLRSSRVSCRVRAR